MIKYICPVTSFCLYFTYTYLLPSYTSELPADALHLHTLAENAARPIEAVSSLGSRYTIGSSTNVLYVASGGSDDWTKGAFGVDLSYCWELPGGGKYFRKLFILTLTGLFRYFWI